MTQLSQKQKLHWYQNEGGKIAPFESHEVLAMSAFLLQDIQQKKAKILNAYLSAI